MIEISQLSVMSLRIELFFRECYLGHGTGTIWRSSAGARLLTNWHVLSGRNPRSGQALDKRGALPDRAVIWWISSIDNRQGLSSEIALRDSAGMPLWRIHPSLGKTIDLATIETEPPALAIKSFMNDLPSTPIKLAVGADAFIVGFPYGRDQGLLPVWKRGSLATEPALAVPGRAYQLIDTASRPGMSGSPIYLYERNGHTLDDNSFAVANRPVHRFIGVYSGRLSSESALDLELGMYWPQAHCDQILVFGKPDPEGW